MTFTITQDVAGDYTVTIGNLSGSFTVLGIPVVTEPEGEPAEFVISDLSVSPEEVGIDETVTITALVSNIGDLEGTYQVELKIAGAVVSVRTVTLAGGGSQEITFTTTENTAGGYRVSIDEESTTFMVTPGITSSEPEETPEPSRLNWWLVGGAIAAAIFVVIVALLVRRQFQVSPHS